MTTTNQANVDKVVAAVRAIGPQRLISAATLSDLVEMTPKEFRAALCVAVEQGLVGRRHSSSLGVNYYMI